MDKADWVFVVFITIICIFACCLVFCMGYEQSKNNILNKLCGETNGKYDFCIEQKQWGIK